MSPDRVVVGVESKRAKELMGKLYRPFLLEQFPGNIYRYTQCGNDKIRSKLYAGYRISFMNDIAKFMRIGGS